MVGTSTLSTTPRTRRCRTGDLALHVLGERALGAADEEVGLDADLHQLAHECCVGLVLTSPAAAMYGTR
jgi:hypothetical protein